MADAPTGAASNRLRKDERSSRSKRRGDVIFADQIVQTREAVANARELLKSVSKPREGR